MGHAFVVAVECRLRRGNGDLRHHAHTQRLARTSGNQGHYPQSAARTLREILTAFCFGYMPRQLNYGCSAGTSNLGTGPWLTRKKTWLSHTER
jgi:hypothetical protein